MMNNMKIKNIKYERKEVKICLVILFGILILSAFFWVSSNPGKKYTFIFESTDTNDISVEYRYLPRKKYPENVVQYVNEIVLGPKNERYRFLFSYGTIVKTCFVRDDVLYVNLSDDVLDRAGSCSEIKKGIELFKKNVLNTFSKINSIEMYIGDRSIYIQ